MKLPKPRTYRSDKMKWENAIQAGENAAGFTAQTPNGTAHWQGTGWNQECHTWQWEQNKPCPVAPGGRSNRTGE